MTAAPDGFNPRTSKVSLMVLQPTPFCNINCKYCYLPDRTVTNRMSPQILEQSLRFVLRQPERLAEGMVIAWHCGEPLAVPLDFYQRAFDLLSRLTPDSVKIENSIQTNATLIDQRWCDFMKQHRVSVGVSIDGPQWIHDRRRVDRAGRGTFTRAMRGIELLKSNDVAFSTIGVLSIDSLQFPEEIWRFYKDLGVRSLAFNLEDVEGVNRASSLSGPGSFSLVESFFRKLLQLRDQEAPDVHIRELDYFFHGLPGWHGEIRTMENVPLCIIGIDWEGNLSTFSPELLGMKDPRYGDFVVGNVANSTLDGILVDPKFTALYHDVAGGIKKCRTSCEYFCMCGGGTPSTKLQQNGTFDSAETLACRLRIKAICNVALDFLEKKYRVARGPGQSVKQRVNSLLPLVGHTAPGVAAAQGLLKKSPVLPEPFAKKLHIRPTEAQPMALRHLYETHRWFDLRDLLEKNDAGEAFYRGAVASAFGKHSRCLREFDLIPQSTPGSAEACELMSWMLVREGKFRQALLYANKSAMQCHCDRLSTLVDTISRLSWCPDQCSTQGGHSILNYEMVDGNMFIPVLANGRRANFMIDSGASLSLVTESEARRVGLTLADCSLGPTQIYGATGALTDVQLAVAELCVGNWQLKNVAFAVLQDNQFDFPTGYKGAIGLPVLLALQALRWDAQGKMELGFPQQIVRTKANVCFDNADLIVQTRFHDRNLSLVLDTGSGATLLWPPFAKEYPHVVEGAQQGEFCRVYGVGGDEAIETLLLDGFHLGIGSFDAMVDSVNVLMRRTTPNSDWLAGRLGMDLLKANSVTLDFRSMNLILE